MALGLERRDETAAQQRPGDVDLRALLGVEEWVLDCVFVAIVLAWYAIGSLLFKTEKQRAYLITFLNCCVAVVVGAHTMHNVVRYDMSINPMSLTETAVTRIEVRFFRVVQILDVAVGVLCYPRQLHLLTTWVHHTCYTLLCYWMLRERVSILFSVCLLEELPTLIMAMGVIHKPLRSDMGFGISYGMLRVALHTLLAYNAVTYSGGDERIHVIRFNFALTWCLHVNWFVAWVRQQLRLRREASSRAKGFKVKQ